MARALGPLLGKYLRSLLKIPLMKQQYWVIDALDECKAGSELMSFLAKAQELWPLSILVIFVSPSSITSETTSIV
jgi:hypothetical protein